MSGEVIPFNNVAALPANLAAKFGDDADSLISGGGGFPSLSIRGSKWRIKVDGDEVPLTNLEGDPVPTVDLVIIRAVEGLSKNYYASQYVEGDDSAPTCYSVDGDKPDAGSEKRQCDTCAACPHNVWGSKITPQGNKTKACSDSKIIAVTFPSDLENEALGGAMMLRIPAASLKDLTRFGKGMKQQGYVPQQIAMRVGFDMDASFPKLTFRAIKPLAQEEVNVIGELYDSDQVGNIINAGDFSKARATVDVPAPVVDTEFSGDEVAPAPVIGKPKAAAKAKPKAKPKAVVPTAATEPEPEPVAEQAPSVDADLDNILGDL
jgi:hypothetical protein